MDFGHTLIAGIAIVLGRGGSIALVPIILLYKSRRIRTIHETALQLAQKGQPVRPELFLGSDEPASDLRRSIVPVALGFGLALFMHQLNDAWSISLVPIFMGLGFLVVWRRETGKKMDRSISD